MNRHDLKLKLIFLLTEEPRSTLQIAAELGVARRTAQKMLVDLERAGAGVVKMGTKYGVHLEAGWPWKFGALQATAEEPQTEQPCEANS
jgi:Mn-dependent DtxR family transcriptional regulator